MDGGIELIFMVILKCRLREYTGLRSMIPESGATADARNSQTVDDIGFCGMDTERLVKPVYKMFVR